MWYRVTIGQDGAIRSCALVEYTLKDSETILYVDAYSPASAIAEAKSAYSRGYHKSLRETKRAAGDCLSCPKKAAEGSAFCAHCKDEQKVLREERKAIKKALGLPDTAIMPAIYRAKRTSPEAVQYGRVKNLHRYQTLSDCLDILTKKPSLAAAKNAVRNEMAKVAPPKEKITAFRRGQMKIAQ